MEIKRNGEKESVIYGTPIKNPINMEFKVEEEYYNTLCKIAAYYKWSLYEALEALVQFSDEFITEIEMDHKRFYGDSDDDEI